MPLFMKLILAIFLFVGVTSYGQSNTSYLVRYFTTVNTFLPDSVKDTKSKTAHSDTLEPGTVTVNLPEIKIEATFYILANQNSSKQYIDSIISISGGKGNLDIPDTIYYSEGKWTKLQEGKLSDLKTRSFDFIKTKEVTEILGFKCTKYLAFDNMLEIWATDQLPNTLIPFTGLTQFTQGILELTDHSSNTKIIATRVLISF